MSRKTQRVVLKSQAREMISKVYDFMKKEATSNYAEKLTDARWRTAQAVGVSESTVTRVLRERRVYEMKHNIKPATESNTAVVKDESGATASTNDEKDPLADEDTDSEIEASTSHATANQSTRAAMFTSPMEKRKVKPRKFNLDESNFDAIRKIIQNYYKEHHEYPKLSELKNILKERIQLDASVSTLRRLLQTLGYYRWRKSVASKKVQTQKQECSD
ncbi:hypothetical protein O3G_MSEX001913 [Manduca sexta]|uniref:Uncharacterized protein n=1 Tax=Manduca sexta TaxID=7130 RepID=A0A921YLM5_MANSE|nr:hypothetical protein O3G_MSEX001913 [Manduca sexta]